MNKNLAIILALLGVIVGLAAIWFFMDMHYSNNETRLRNLLTAKQRDNKSQLDNLQKTISQTAQVSKAQMDFTIALVTGNSTARAGKGGGGSLINAVHEAIPTADPKTQLNLQNIIAGNRDAWTKRQTEILDMKRAHDDCLTTRPSSWFVGNRPPIDVQIVTSTRAEAAFDTGRDDDANVFAK